MYIVFDVLILLVHCLRYPTPICAHTHTLCTCTDSPAELNVVLKSKPTDMETSNNINHIAQSFTAPAETHDRYKEETGFRYVDLAMVSLPTPF